MTTLATLVSKLYIYIYITQQTESLECQSERSSSRRNVVEILRQLQKQSNIHVKDVVTTSVNTTLNQINNNVKVTTTANAVTVNIHCAVPHILHTMEGERILSWHFSRNRDRKGENTLMAL